MNKTVLWLQLQEKLEGQKKPLPQCDKLSSHFMCITLYRDIVTAKQRKFILDQCDISSDTKSFLTM